MILNRTQARFKSQHRCFLDALFACAVFSFSTPASADGFGVEAYLGFRQPIRTSVAPDGQSVLVSVEWNDVEHNVRRSDIDLVRLSDGTSSRIGDGGEAVWCHDGAIAYLRRSGAAANFHVLMGVGGEEKGFAPTNVLYFTCDARSARAVLVAGDRAQESARDSAPETRLYIADFATGEVRPVPNSAGASTADWSPTADVIAITRNNDIELIDLSGQARPLVVQPGLDTTPHWSPDGRNLVFASMFGVERSPSALALIGVGGGAPVHLAQNFTAWVRGAPPRWWGWSDAHTLLFSGLENMRSNVNRLDIRRPAQSRPIAAGDYVAAGCSVAGQTLACLESTPVAPPELVVRASSGALRARIAIGAASYDEGDWRALRWRSRDGTEITGQLALPPAGCAQKCPLVVLMIGSHGVFDFSFTTRTSADDTWFPPINAHVLANAGYAVLMPNPRGSWSFGAPFQRLVQGDPAIGPTSDIESGVDTLIEEGVADPARLAIIGLGTYDGYRLVYDLTQTRRYRAAVVAFPIFDLAYWHGVEGEWTDRYLGGSPFLDRQRFDAIDPSRHAAAMVTPVLVFSRDEEAPLSVAGQGTMLARALRERGVEVSEQRYPETFLGWSTPSDVAAGARQTLAWLEAHLGASPSTH